VIEVLTSSPSDRPRQHSQEGKAPLRRFRSSFLGTARISDSEGLTAIPIQNFPLPWGNDSTCAQKLPGMLALPFCGIPAGVLRRSANFGVNQHRDHACQVYEFSHLFHDVHLAARPSSSFVPRITPYVLRCFPCVLFQPLPLRSSGLASPPPAHL